MERSTRGSARALAVLCAAVLAFALFGVADAGAATKKTTVKVATVPGVGKVLVDRSDKTLYTLTDASGAAVECTDACLSAWPAATVSANAKVKAPKGVKSLSITDTNQIAWKDLPLYTFTEERRHAVDYLAPNHYSSTHPLSLFTQHVIVQRWDGDVQVGLVDGVLLVARQDRREPLDQRRAVGVVGAAALELGLEDLGPPLHEPTQQREVFALGEALVPPGAELVEIERFEVLCEGGVADAVDASVGGVFLLVVGHAAHPTAARAGDDVTPISKRRAAPCTG